MVSNRIQQWDFYRSGIIEQIFGFARLRADQLNVSAPRERGPNRLERRNNTVIPVISASARAQEFSLTGSERYRTYMEANPDALQETGLNRSQTRLILNYVNGERSVTMIRNYISAESGQDIPLEGVVSYLEMLREMDWVEY